MLCLSNPLNLIFLQSHLIQLQDRQFSPIPRVAEEQAINTSKKEILVDYMDHPHTTKNQIAVKGI
jgi:hypothetical protein